MKLWQVFKARPAWAALSALKKNPKLAYRLLKYQKKVNAELDTINEHRTAIVYEAAGVEPPPKGEEKLVTIGAGTEQAQVFHTKFTEFLEGDSDLAWIGISMDELIDGLAETNALSEDDLELLEPFFQQPAPAEQATPAAAPAA